MQILLTYFKFYNSNSRTYDYTFLYFIKLRMVNLSCIKYMLFTTLFYNKISVFSKKRHSFTLNYPSKPENIHLSKTKNNDCKKVKQTKLKKS